MALERTNQCAARPTLPLSGSSRIMILNPERVAYVGLLGMPRMREFGSITVYAALDTPFRIAVGDGTWETASMAVVAPYVRHQVATSDREIGVLKIEPESVDMKRLPAFLLPGGRQDACHPVATRLRRTFLGLLRAEFGGDLSQLDIDQLFFGQDLERRQQLDPRISLVIRKMNQEPCELFSAEDCARLANLSTSRLLHLFKSEVDTTFRRFRAWKRARAFLAHVNRKTNLTALALEIGYPDSSHFSHSIRYFYGLTPKDIFAGSRHLALVLQHGRPAAAAPA